MQRRTFLAAAALPFWNAALARSATGTTSKVVDTLRRISLERRAALERNAEGRTLGALHRLIPEIDEVEVWNGASRARAGKTLRLVAWNMERGRHWKDGVRLIRETEALRDPDIILLGEMDLGMARSANAHTTREMAAALGMNYAYGVEFLELTGGELGEREALPRRERVGIPRQRDPLPLSAARRADAALPRDREVVRGQGGQRIGEGAEAAGRAHGAFRHRRAWDATSPSWRRTSRARPRTAPCGRPRRGCSSTSCAPTRRIRR